MIFQKDIAFNCLYLFVSLEFSNISSTVSIDVSPDLYLQCVCRIGFHS